MAAPSVLSEQAAKALNLFEDGCLRNRHAFLSKLRARSAAYHGLVEARSTAKSWQSQYFPPFVGHIIDATLAAVVDGKLSFRVKPQPRFYDPEEYKSVQAGAKAHEILHGAQLKADRFHETEQPFALQDAIYGLSVYKNYWRRDIRMKPRLKVVPDEHAAEQGIFLPRLVESESVQVCYDGPHSEVVNIEDFFWHEASVSLQKAPVIAHRVWAHFSELKRLESKGQYKNVDELKDSQDQQGDYIDYRITDGTSRSRDMIEVLEIWWQEPDGIYTVTLGNRRVELSAPRKNPFWHGEYPFVVCSTRPDLFSIPGKSQVEKIAALQEGHWDLFNQLLDNVKLMNNAIFIIGDDVTDPDSLEFAPGARWPVEGNPNEMVMPWAPNPISAEIAVPHLTRLEQMMQNLAGGYPFTTTSEGGNSANTATQAALVTNIAQQATVRLKEQLAYAQERVGQQRTELNQQFLRTSIMVEQIGIDTAEEFAEIAPYLLQGDYLFDVAPMVESLMRSERRAEANSMFQTFLQAAQVWVLLAQSGAATPLNADEFAREWLDSYDVGDSNRFFSARPQPPADAVPGTQQLASTDPQPPGITAQQSIDPAVSPSAQASLSGATHMARLGSQGNGGVANT